MKRILFVGLLLLAVCLCWRGFAQGKYVETYWFRDRPGLLASVAYGNDTFVAAGNDLVILTSHNGTNWVRTSAAISDPLVGINYSSEKYVAGGDAVTVIYPEQTNVPVVVPSIHTQLRAVGFGNGTFVIVGDCGWILTSEDGDRWTERWSGTSEDLCGIAWGAKTFVAIGDAGTILTSRDGSHWKAEKSGTGVGLNAVAFGNGQFMVVGEEGEVLNSQDGTSWSVTHPLGSEPVACVAYAGAQFMACSPAGIGSVEMSSDGRQWRGGLSPHVGSKIGLSSGGGYFIATGDSGRPSLSRDGRDWSRASLEGSGAGFEVILAAAYGKGLFVGVGSRVETSKDGLTWRQEKTPESKLLWGYLRPDKKFEPDFIQKHRTGRGYGMVENRAYPLESEDGVTWRGRSPVRLPGTIVGNTRVYAVPPRDNGSAGSRWEAAVLASEDGISWVRLRAAQSSRPRVLPGPFVPAPVPVAGAAVAVPTTANVVASMYLNGRGYELSLPTKGGPVFYVQASTDLMHWTELVILTNSPTGMVFEDPDAKLYPKRFYRLRLP
jgi:hypothetical protein